MCTPQHLFREALETKTPEVLTINGRAEVVIQDAESYQDLLGRLHHMETVAAIRDLVREDQKKRAGERLETLLLRGLESPASAWTKDDVDHIKNAVRERLAAKQNTP